ncbi:MAG: hypothetical protein AAGI54_08620 [Planctomycetota bacterium]
MQALVCRSCGANLHADDVNTAMGIAKCRHCGAVYAFGAAMGGGAAKAGSGEPGPRVRAEVEKPSGFTIEEDPYRFRITQRWLTWKVIPLAVFAVLWDGFLVFWYFMAINAIRDGDAMAWVMALFPVLHLAAGVVITYAVIATLFNTTTIDVNDRELSVRHGPLWVPGNKTLRSLDIKQLYCKTKVNNGKNGTTFSYQLFAIKNDGKEEKLLTNLDQQSHAIYVEQQIERVMGIKDEAVAGETV